MILVDSSIWIDLLADRTTIQTEMLTRYIEAQEDVCIGDLVLVEVLQGIRHDGEFRRHLARLSLFSRVTIADADLAVQAATFYRTLRARGITIRKTIDTLIATRCIRDGIPLLYSDRDFDPFVQHCGLRSALVDFGAS